MVRVFESSSRQILGIEDLSKNERSEIFDRLQAYETSQFADLFSNSDILKGAVIGCLFETPSVRSKLGFQSAFMKLGGSVIDLDAVASRLFGGKAKENVNDVIRYISIYCDIIALRSYNESITNQLLTSCHVSIISAGIFAGEHPITGLAQLYAIKRETGRLDNHKILFISSCASSSLASIYKGLASNPSNKFTFLTPVLQPSFTRSSNIDFVSPKNVPIDEIELQEFTLLFIDESERSDVSERDIENMRFGQRHRQTSSSLERISHIKPILNLLDDNLKELVAKDCVHQSRLSFAAKVALFELLAKRHRMN